MAEYPLNLLEEMIKKFLINFYDRFFLCFYLSRESVKYLYYYKEIDRRN